MSLLGPVFKREPGGRQPYIPLGPFHLRLPFIHYRFETADYIQGLIMCAVCLGIIPVLTEYLGMPFDIAYNGRYFERLSLPVAFSLGRPGRTGMDHPCDPFAACMAESIP